MTDRKKGHAGAQSTASYAKYSNAQTAIRNSDGSQVPDDEGSDGSDSNVDATETTEENSPLRGGGAGPSHSTSGDLNCEHGAQVTSGHGNVLSGLKNIFGFNQSYSGPSDPHRKGNVQPKNSRDKAHEDSLNGMQETGLIESKQEGQKMGTTVTPLRNKNQEVEAKKKAANDETTGLNDEGRTAKKENKNNVLKKKEEDHQVGPATERKKGEAERTHLNENIQKMGRKITELEKKNQELETKKKEANDEIARLDDEIRTLKKENKSKLKKSEKDAKRKEEDHQANLRTERTSWDTERNRLKNEHLVNLKAERTWYDTEKTRLENEHHLKLTKERSWWNTECTRLENEKKGLCSEFRELEAKYNSLSDRYDATKKKFQNDLLSRDNEIKKSEENNKSLRRYIDSTRNAQEPLRGENTYVQDFEDLNNKITLWIGAQSKKNAKATLQINTRTAILTKTKSFGNYGVHTATQIESSLKELYVSRKTRAPLVRHILALFLFDRIFYPFAFAIKNPDPSHEASNYLKYLEDDLFTQGHDFSKILMIRQAIARGTLNSCKSTVGKQTEECITELVDLLCQLLPMSSVQDIKKNSKKFIESAVQLKYQMTEEQAIYRFYFLFSNTPVTNEQMDIADEEGSVGIIRFCIFPGIERFILNEDGKMDKLMVVKAKGVLVDENTGGKMNEVTTEAESAPENSVKP